jgi:hypothetical protein
MTMRCKTTRADDAALRQRMKAIADDRRRFGYRRLHVLLKREGYAINHKKLFRLYREEKLAVRWRVRSETSNIGSMKISRGAWPSRGRSGDTSTALTSKTRRKGALRRRCSRKSPASPCPLGRTTRSAAKLRFVSGRTTSGC